MILTVDAVSGNCHAHAMPDSLRVAGGRALAVLLAAGHGGMAPGQGPCMVVAPGLLAGQGLAMSGRCAVACTVPGVGGVAHSSAGGAAATALARCGVRAVLVRGVVPVEQEGRVLIIDGTKGALVPSPLHTEARDTKTSTRRMAALAAHWPEAACLVDAGHLGRLGVPIANTAFSDARLHPSSHAGSCSGMVLGMAGIDAMAILKGGAAKGDKAVAGRAFAVAMRAHAARTGAACSLRCGSQCPGGHGGHARKWPGFAEHWSSGQAGADAALLERYATLCDALQLDAFALATRLEQLVEQGQLTRNAADVLDALELLGQRPAGARLLEGLREWMPPRRPGKGGRQGMVMDTLGLCRYAMDALEGDAAVRVAFEELFTAVTGCSAANLDALVDAAWTVENGGPAPMPHRGRGALGSVREEE